MNQKASKAQFNEITVNIVVTIQQNDINMQIQVSPLTAFNLLIKGINKQILPNKFEDTLEYKLGSDDQIDQSETRSLQQLGFKENCILYIRERSGENHNIAEYYFDQGNELHIQGKYEEAISSYSRAILLNPNKPQFYYSKGKSLLALNRQDDAIKFYEQAIEIYRESYLQLKSNMQQFNM